MMLSFEIEIAQYEYTDFLYVLRFNKKETNDHGANNTDDEDEVEDGVMPTTKEGFVEIVGSKQERDEDVLRQLSGQILARLNL